MHTISISAEKLFSLFNWLPVTNTLFTAWVVMLLILIWAFFGGRHPKLIPSGIQNFTEMLLEVLLKAMEGIVGSAKQAREFFALVATIFLFVLFSNWFGLLPGVGSIGFFEEAGSETEIAEEVTSHETVDEVEAVTASHAEASEEGAEAALAEEGAAAETHEEGESGGHHVGFVPLFRAASSDLSFTLAIALCAVIYVQYIGFKHLKLGYLKKFINFKNPILFFVGILEIISEFAKIVSFSFRLFGNIFAGEVLLVVMTFLVPFIIPIPFYGLEIFVGMVQAGVFAALTLVFLKGATAHH